MPLVLAGKVGLAVVLSGWVGHLATAVASSDPSTLVTQIVSLVTSLTGLIAALAGLVVHLRHRDADVVYVEPRDVREHEPHDGDETVVIARQSGRVAGVARQSRRVARVKADRATKAAKAVKDEEDE